MLLAGCGGPERSEASLSADEERQLNEAAAMLDEPEAKQEETTPAPPSESERE